MYLHTHPVRMHNTKSRHEHHRHSRIHTRDFYCGPLVLRKVCGGSGGERVAGCVGYYLPRTVTNARQRHFHSHPQLPTTTHRPPPLPLRRPRVFLRCHCLPSPPPPPPPSLPPPPFLSGARNVTSISSSGPTRHLCQPSEGASGDCTTTTAATTLLTSLTLALARHVREIEEGERRCEEARVEGRCGRWRRRLDVSRPHVIPSYSTLSVRTSAARRIYERFSAILPP